MTAEKDPRIEAVAKLLHPGFPCPKCARGDHAACTGFDGSLTEHPDSQPLCICLECQPNRYRNLVEHGWSNP